MPITNADLKLMITGPARKPKSESFRFDRPLDQWDMEQILNRGGVAFCRAIKREMAHKLADHIIEKCNLIVEPESMKPGCVFSIEFTIDDRGTYQNWLPVERRQGHKEGREEGIGVGMEAMRKKIPYGVEPDLFYE